MPGVRSMERMPQIVACALETISDAARRDAAITAARQQLAQTSNKTLDASAIAQLDSTLHIQGASPRLGAAR